MYIAPLVTLSYCVHQLCIVFES